MLKKSDISNVYTLADKELEPVMAESNGVSEDVIKLAINRLDASHRTQLQLAKFNILASSHEEEIQHKIYSQTPNIARDVCKFISVSINPAADIVESVTAVYNRPPQRTLDTESEDQGRATMRIFRESQMDAIGKQLAQVAYFVGPVAVLPAVRRGMLRLDALMPFDYEPVLDIQDPCGKPVALVFTTSLHGADYGVVDESGKRFYKVEQEGASGQVKSMQLVLESLSDVGVPAFEILRFDVCTNPMDWHNAGKHKRIVDGALEVGRIVARMGYVRRTQDKKLLGIIGDLDKLADGQNLGDDHPVMAQIDENAATQQVTFDALDYDTSPNNFFAQIRFFIENMAESTGVSVQLTTPSGPASYDLRFDHDQLAELRDALVWHAEHFERHLWPLCMDIVKASDHPLNFTLPNGEELSQNLAVEFGRLTRRFADPAQERDHWDWLLKKGQASMADLWRRFRDPFATDAEATDAMLDNMAINGAIWAEAAARNQPLAADVDGSEGQPLSQNMVSPAQANGMLGPIARGAQNNNEE